MEPKLLTADRFVDKETGCSYRYVYSSTEYFRPHFHDYYEIFILLEGEATHLVNGSTLPLSKGCAVFVRPSDTHDYVCSSNEFHMLNITFTVETADAMFAYLGDGFDRERLHTSLLPPSSMLSEEALDRLEEKMSALRLMDTRRPAERRTVLRALLLSLLTELFSPKPEERCDAPAWLSELRVRLREDGNFKEGISVIPRLCDKSREHISRSMKKHYGETVSEYVNSLRLSYIADMLRHSDHKILDIIFESGFGNVSWCCKCFTERYGMTMSQYRRG